MKAKITATKEQLQSIAIAVDTEIYPDAIVNIKKLPKGEAPEHPLYKEFYEIKTGSFRGYCYTIPVEFLELI